MSEYDALFPRLIASPYIYIVCRLYIQRIPKSRITARLIGALCAVRMLIEKQNQNQSNIAGFVTIFWQGVLKLGMVYAILPPPLCPTRQQQCVNLVPIYSICLVILWLTIVCSGLHMWWFHPGNPLTNGPCFKATRAMSSWGRKEVTPVGRKLQLEPRFFLSHLSTLR